MCDCMERDEWQQTWARPGCEKMPFNRQREGSFSLGRAELRVYEQYWRNDFHRHLSMLLWNSEDWRRNGAPSAGPAECCWLLSSPHRHIQDMQSSVHNRYPRRMWLLMESFRSSAHQTHPPQNYLFFFFNWLVHLLLVKYKSFLEEKMFFY